MYTCAKCSKQHDEREFCPSKPSWCRPCYVEYHREYRLKNKEKLRKYSYERWVSQKEKLLAQQKKWRENNLKERLEVERGYREKKPRTDYHREYKEKNRDKIRENQKRYRERNREKVNARAILNYYVEKGEIDVPAKCQHCEKEVKVEAHHFDYDKPREVIWVCDKCHKLIHKVIKSKNIGDK